MTVSANTVKNIAAAGTAAGYTLRSSLLTPEAIIAETAVTEITERGATRMDDQTNEASMERRKKEGYF